MSNHAPSDLIKYMSNKDMRMKCRGNISEVLEAFAQAWGTLD